MHKRLIFKCSQKDTQNPNNGLIKANQITQKERLFQILAKTLSFLIPIKSWRRRVRQYLVDLLMKKKDNLKAVPLFYFTSNSNFGDLLNRDLMDFFQVKYYSSTSSRARLVCIGSILQRFLLSRSRKSKKQMHVFGAGFIKPEESDAEKFCRPMIFHALRGKLSKKRCEHITGQNLDHIALGDPGLLVRYMFPDIKPSPVYDVGVICHYVDKESPYLKNIRLAKNSVHFIDVSQKTSDFVQEVAKCKFILSSAMHGLICADSLGIPNKHIVLGDKVVGGEYKFKDYYSIFKNFEYNPVYLKNTFISDSDIQKYLSEYTLDSSEIEQICQDLVKAFPRKEFECQK